MTVPSSSRRSNIRHVPTFGKLITLLFVLATCTTVESFSLRSASSENATIRNDTIGYRLPTNVVPIHYDLKLESGIAAGDFNFCGESATEIDVREATREIVLNWRDLSLDEGHTRLEKVTGESFSPKKHRYDQDRQMLTLIFDEIVQPSIYTLRLKFSGVLRKELNGFYTFSDVKENGDVTWLAVTHFQPISARLAFPCWDEPAFKATFNVSLKHHANYTALSNMPAFERSIADGEEDKVWTRFERTPIMPTNVVAFLISDFESISSADGNVRVWARKSTLPSLHFFLKSVEKISDELKNYMNTSVVVPKIDHVALSAYSSGATENWGLIMYYEPRVIYNENETTVNHMDSIVMIGAHELTHQWFGNLVGPRWWKYLWMSEGFAAYFQFYITDKAYEESRMMDLFPLLVMHHIAFPMDVCSGYSPITRNIDTPSEIYSTFSFVAYRKTPSLLRMLSHFISEEVFHTGLLEYLHENRYKTATPDDLWRSLQNVLDQSDVPHDNFTIKEVMDTWTGQEGYPTIVVTRDYDTGTVQVRQVVADSEQKEECKNKWWIPLNFVSQENPDFSSTLPTHWLNPSEEVMTIEGLPKDGWLIFNVQQTGHYRVNYDLENWRRIANYLNSDDYKNIHVLNRLQIIDDAYESVTNEEIPPAVLGMLVNYFSRENDPIAWMLAVRMISDENLLRSNLKTSSIIEPYVRRIISDKLKDADFRDNSKDDRWTRRMKVVIRYLACMVDVPECYGNATAELVEYLQNPDSKKIYPDSKQWVFCTGLKKANESVWNGIYDLYNKTSEESLLSYLACSNNRTILEKYLNMTLSKGSPIYLSENVIDEMTRKADIGVDVLVDFMSANLDELSKMEGLSIFTYYLSHTIFTREQLSKMIAIYASQGESPDEMIKNFEERHNRSITYSSILQNFVNATIDG